VKWRPWKKISRDLEDAATQHNSKKLQSDKKIVEERQEEHFDNMKKI
jgi:hypothetical protein